MSISKVSKNWSTGKPARWACCMRVLPQECQGRARAERPMPLSGGGIFGAETPLRSSHARGFDRRTIVRCATFGSGQNRTSREDFQMIDSQRSARNAVLSSRTNNCGCSTRRSGRRCQPGRNRTGWCSSVQFRILARGRCRPEGR